MPLIPGSPEWYANIDRMLEAERSQPERWYYTSFAKCDGSGFAGALCLRARGPTHGVGARQRTGSHAARRRGVGT